MLPPVEEVEDAQKHHLQEDDSDTEVAQINQIMQVTDSSNKSPIQDYFAENTVMSMGHSSSFSIHRPQKAEDKPSSRTLLRSMSLPGNDDSPDQNELSYWRVTHATDSYDVYTPNKDVPTASTPRIRSQMSWNGDCVPLDFGSAKPRREGRIKMQKSKQVCEN